MLESTLAKRRMCTSGRALSQSKYRHDARRSKMIGQREPGKLPPYKQFKSPQKCDCLSEPTRASFCMYFSSNKCFTCFTTFCLFAEFFLQRWGLRFCFKPAGPRALVAGIRHFHHRGLDLIPSQGTKIPLQAAAPCSPWDHYDWGKITFIYSHIAQSVFHWTLFSKKVPTPQNKMYLGQINLRNTGLLNPGFTASFLRAPRMSIKGVLNLYMRDIMLHFPDLPEHIPLPRDNLWN